MSKANPNVGCGGLIAFLVVLWIVKVIVVDFVWPVIVAVWDWIVSVYNAALTNAHYSSYLLYPVVGGLGVAIVLGFGHGVANYVRCFLKETGPDRPWRT